LSIVETRPVDESLLQNIKKEQLLFVTLGLKPCKKDGRKLLIEHSARATAMVVFLKTTHEIKRSISDILEILISSVLLRNFPENPTHPTGGTHRILETADITFRLI
jgi:hypothetical protein